MHPTHPSIYIPQDNNSIYFDSIPSSDMLDLLPEPLMMMKPIPSEGGAPPAKILSFRAPNSAEKEEAEEAKAGDQKTDEQLARELFEKLNA